MSKRPQAYPQEFRTQIVELYKSGRSASELAREFGCHVSSITSWVKQSDQVQLTGISDLPLTPSERQELRQLRRKLKQVQTERDILAKATAWFAHNSEHK